MSLATPGPSSRIGGLLHVGRYRYTKRHSHGHSHGHSPSFDIFKLFLLCVYLNFYSLYIIRKGNKNITSIRFSVDKYLVPDRAGDIV